MAHIVGVKIVYVYVYVCRHVCTRFYVCACVCVVCGLGFMGTTQALEVSSEHTDLPFNVGNSRIEVSTEMTLWKFRGPTYFSITYIVI